MTAPPSPSNRWPRWLQGAWGWVALAAAVYTGAFLVLTFVRPFTAETQLIISDLAYLPLSLLAMAAAWRLWRAVAVPKVARRAWVWIALAMACNFVADVVWAYYEINLNILNPSPSLADVFYLSSYVFLFIGFLLFPYAPVTRSEWWRMVLNVAIVVVATWMVLWYVIVAPQVADLTLNLDSLVSLAYPVADLVALYGLMVFIFRHPEIAQRPSWWLLTAGLGVYLVADVVYLVQDLNGWYVSGMPVDAAWMVAYVLFAWAALAQYAELHNGGDQLERATGVSYWWVLPYVMLALGYLLTGVEMIKHMVLDPTLWGLFLGSALLTLLTSLRQIWDLHENQRLNNLLRQQVQQLQETGVALNRSHYLASIGTLAAGAAHELNNPFAAIIASVAALKRRIAKGDWQQAYYLSTIERIERSAWQGSKIVNALEAYARGVDLKLSRTSAQRIAREAVAAVALPAEVTLTTELPPQMQELICDREKVVAVLTNILKNAQQAIQPPGAIALTVTLTEEDEVVFTITDNGGGMPPKVLARVFDLFFTTKAVDQGHGLSLPIGRGIVRAHGGDIQITSQVGQGTQVQVTLPREPPYQSAAE